MSEFEKKIRELVGDDECSIPIVVLYVGLVFGLHQLIYSTLQDLKKGNEIND